ncbi:MAG: protease SohB [Myxococcota bacterium]
MDAVLWETLAFIVKAVVVFVTFAACVLVFAVRIRGGRGDAEPRLQVERLNDKLQRRLDTLRLNLLDRKDAKRYLKELKARDKQAERAPNRVFVLDFKGDILASRVEQLRDEVTAVLGVADPGDEVLVRLESPGGAAPSYGLAAAQLARFRPRDIRLTVAVDRVAASGGYMMACVADYIALAPFAILGSIGVAAPLPNVHRLLRRIGVDYEDATAGTYKRTVSPLAEVTEEGRAKFQEQLDELHTLFKQFVKDHRPTLDIDRVATGEAWVGRRALELGLADAITTSDDLVLTRIESHDVYRVWIERPKSVAEKLSGGAETLVGRLADAVSDGLRQRLARRAL